VNTAMAVLCSMCLVVCACVAFYATSAVHKPLDVWQTLRWRFQLLRNSGVVGASGSPTEGL
jgi:formate hydrogenlyase subunit 6/NADH:ubiquinone oxidoreductase subunit I